MENANPRMILMTHEFPFGNSETSFVGPELVVLYQHFSIPAILTFPGGEEASKIDSNTSVAIANENQKYPIAFAIKLKYYLLIFTPWLIGFIKKAIQYQISFIQVKIQISQMRKYLHLATFIHQQNKIHHASVLYSYWFDHWNVAACIYKRLYNSDVTVISRAHRYEIDIETYNLPFFPFRNLQFGVSNLICFISEKWREKLKNLHPNYAKKLVVAKMGVSDNKILSVAPSDGKFHIVSISGNIPVKRMELQVGALNLINLPVVWHHFGAQKNDDSIHKLITNTNLKYINHGFVQPKDLHEWLGNNFVHFLLNTSHIEGIPVSMMECLAAGIPIIGTDVGGVSELINSKTGILLAPEIKSKELSKIIKNALENYDFIGAKRLGVQDFFKENYSSTKNYTHFCNTIKNQ